MLKIYNALTRKKEEFQPIEVGKIGMYVCGPTVYDHCHLGHGRGYISMDVIRRYLEYAGYEVRYIMNYTDVGHLVGDGEIGEDKIQKKAKIEKIDPMEVVEKYIQSAKEDFDALNIKPANFFPRPTQYIDQIIKFIEGLIEKEFAYEMNGSVYFSVDKFPEYGKLSGRKPEDLLSGARVEVNEEKRNPLDFALWINAPKEHLLKWKSPWGEEGYPGWHIECSVMSCDLLGQKTFDIHGGGNENIFPHNENEVAQSEALLGEKMANFWVLWNMVNVDGTKMSKSLGNFTIIKDVLKKYPAAVFRLWVISSHYRSVMNYSDESLEQANINLEKINSWIEKLENIDLEKSDEVIDLRSFKKEFEEAMNDDFNTPVALSVVYKLITETNKKKISKKDAEEILDLWRKKWNKVFGLRLEINPSNKVPENIQKLAKEREAARKEKDFEEADRIRDILDKKGFIVEDTESGPKVSKK
ncbi:MAG: cysteine--tRNA ligase [Patescibacteria group bacterium]|jgi:cysteinyl-tRNA synthetase|nr:cysteine--tRNA ligase [Patescibacteria group bacterium]